MARILGISRTTVERKFLYLALQATRNQKKLLDSYRASSDPLELLYFDEMESFEISKCLPVSIPILVVPKTRKILGVRVCSMPAKGPLARISHKKYGPRADDRREAAIDLLTEMKDLVSKTNLTVLSDQNPKYPGWLSAVYPDVRHKTVKGRRGCVTGQGELKRGGFDPLFDLNHSCAMIRANVNRTFRRTWCTTKRRDRLAAHLAIYIDYHNSVLT